MKIEMPDLTGAECGDVAITAAEGGIGYWAQIESYTPSRWSPGDNDVVQDNIEVDPDFVFYYISYESPTDEGEIATDAVTPRLINAGVERALNGGCRKDLADQMRDPEDRSAMDVDAADCVIQLGLFGEIVFG